jgi:trimeric autotransporter adhesin
VVDTIVKFNPTAPAGSRFESQTVLDELGLVVPGNILPGTLTASLFAPNSVTAAAIATGAVTTAALATGAVTAPALGTGAVGPPALAPGAVTAAACGVGIPTAADSNGNPITLTLVVLTAAQYAAIAAPDPNTIYFCT